MAHVEIFRNEIADQTAKEAALNGPLTVDKFKLPTVEATNYFKKDIMGSWKERYNQLSKTKGKLHAKIIDFSPSQKNGSITDEEEKS